MFYLIEKDPFDLSIGIKKKKRLFFFFESQKKRKRVFFFLIPILKSKGCDLRWTCLYNQANTVTEMGLETMVIMCLLYEMCLLSIYGSVLCTPFDVGWSRVVYHTQKPIFLLFLCLLGQLDELGYLTGQSRTLDVTKTAHFAC